MELKIRFTVEYKYNPNKSGEKFSAKINLYLPTDENGLHYLLHSEKVVMGHQLTHYWGERDNEYVTAWDKLYDNDIQKLIKKVSDYINQTTETLKQIKEENEINLKLMPEKEDFTIVI